MFLDNSRYAKVETVEVAAPSGGTTIALKRRRLTPATGDPHTVVSGERLDVLADDAYGDATRFWHIADANTALEADELVRPRPYDREARTIAVPET